MSGDFSKNGPRESAQQPPPEGQDGRPLPPPAFPPGAKRAGAPRSAVRPDDLSSALISPDDPIPDRTGNVPGDAFISPDAPVPHRRPRTKADTEALEDVGEGVVTSMGDDPHMDPAELALGFDPHVLEVVEKVTKLAEALKHRGEAGLRATPEMSRFEVTLRSYCVGYLAGRRAEEEEG